jgi:hypothetical protein
MDKMKIDDKVLAKVAQAILNEYLTSEAQDDLSLNDLHWSDKDLYMAQAKAAITAYLKETQGWRPISEAPKDASNILIVDINADYPTIGIAFWQNEWRAGTLIDWTESSDEDCRRVLGILRTPTHWQPLPTPPTTGE